MRWFQLIELENEQLQRTRIASGIQQQLQRTRIASGIQRQLQRTRIASRIRRHPAEQRR
ncbi:MAG TPA: hypothetical protein VHT27_06465 [Solirubrobacteraceae bacterium]|nr:hypothetical protein [Solirubrobacteraceae bacterium]